MRMLMGLLLCIVMSPAAAESGVEETLSDADALSFNALDSAESRALMGHPNELWRYRGLRALKVDQPVTAARYFRLASRYGDKYSQHVLSLLHWHGVGVERDRALAYAWSDLAAERGYRNLLLVREKMWMELDAIQRERALVEGEALYADYGDQVAKPRLGWEMRKALASATGSRLGFERDRIRFASNDQATGGTAPPRDLYTREGYWDADAYWRVEDGQWNGGRVIVLPIEQLPGTDDPPGAAP